MNICPNTNTPEWKDLEKAVGQTEAYRDFIETGGLIRPAKDVQQKLQTIQDEYYLQKPTEIETAIQDKESLVKLIEKDENPESLGLDFANQEFHINTLNVLSKFLEKIGVQQRLVPAFFNSHGTPIASALAAANFVEGTVDVIDDIEKRPAAWNKIPEETAHFWYRLLKTDSALKEQLWNAAKNSKKLQELVGSTYSDAYADVHGEIMDALTEESIGQLIADAIKRIEQKTGSPADYSFLKAFLDFIKRLTNIFKNINPDPFEIAAMKILSSDLSDLMTFEEYKALHDKVFISEVISNASLKDLKTLEEVIDPGEYFFRTLLLTKYKKKSKFLEKTLKRQYTVNEGSPLEDLPKLRLSKRLPEAFKVPLSEQEKAILVKTNDYKNITPSLKGLPLILEKFKKQPISLGSPLKVDGIKKQEIEIYENVLALIKIENPGLKSISAEDFAHEVYNYLTTNYLLGFANEKGHLSYRIDQTFKHVPDRLSDRSYDMADITDDAVQNMTVEQRQNLARELGLTKENAKVSHRKISLRFNDTYFKKYTHFNYSPSAWGNLTRFYTSKEAMKSGIKDAVLLHEIQNDNIEDIIRYLKSVTQDLDENSIEYLATLEWTYQNNLKLIENSNIRVNNNTSLLNVLPKTWADQTLGNLVQYPINNPYNAFQERVEERYHLYPARITLANKEETNKRLQKVYLQRMTLEDFIRSGGIKQVLSKEKLEDIGRQLKILNDPETLQTQDAYFLPDENQVEPPHDFVAPLSLDQKKAKAANILAIYETEINEYILEFYGDENRPIVKLGVMPKKRGSEDIIDNINSFIIVTHKKWLKQATKDIMFAKQAYIFALGADNARKSVEKYRMLTEKQFSVLYENLKHNQTLLKALVNRNIKIDIAKKSNTSQAEKTKQIEKQEAAYQKAKEDATANKEKLGIQYIEQAKSEEAILNMEKNYFTPLIHQLIQTHIRENGKDTPLYFSGFEITQLTQGNQQTALIYAGKDEVTFSKAEADEIKRKVAVRLQLVSDDTSTEDALKFLTVYKKEDPNHARIITSHILELSGGLPIEVGALYSAMSSIPGVKLEWVFDIPGFTKLVGGYKVNLDNYRYESPLLYGLDQTISPDIFKAASEKARNEIFDFAKKDATSYTMKGPEIIIPVGNKDMNGKIAIKTIKAAESAAKRIAEKINIMYPATGAQPTAQVKIQGNQARIFIITPKSLIEKYFSEGTQLDIAFYRKDIENLVSPEKVDNREATKAVNEFTRELASRFNLSYQVVTAEEAKALTLQANVAWAGESAFFIGGVIYFVGDQFTTKMAIHEFSHPLLRAISVSNPGLFSILYTTLESTPEGKAIIAETKRLYPTSDPNSNLFKEEALVRALTKIAIDERGKTPQSKGFMGFVRNILYSIKQLLRQAFGKKVQVEKLTANTTLEELAVMLKGDHFKLDIETISQSDVVAFMRDTRPEISDINKKEMASLVNIILKSEYGTAAQHLRNIYNNKNHEAMLKVLEDQYGRPKLQEIKSALSSYNKMLENDVKKLAEDMEHVLAQASTLVTTLYTLKDIAATMHAEMDRLSKDVNNKDYIQQISYYSDFIKHWEAFVKDADKSLEKEGLPSDSPIRTLLSSIEKQFRDTKRISKEVAAKGTLSTYHEVLGPLAKSIDDDHEALMKDMVAKGASKETIARHEREYQEFRLSPYIDAEGKKIDPIEKYLIGEMGDANALSSWIEAYMYNGDPVISGFALFIKNNITDVMVEAQKANNDFLRDMVPLLEEIGYNPANIQELGKLVTFVDKIGTRSSENTLEEMSIYTFLNPFKDYRYDLTRLDDEYTKSLNKARLSGKTEDYRQAAEIYAQVRAFKRKYMNQEYRSGFYDKEIIFDSEVGREAYLDRQLLLTQLRLLQKSITSEYTDDAKFAEIDELWRKYRQLHSLQDNYGNPKTGLDFEKAKLLKEYAESNRDFYKWVPYKGAFQKALELYEQKLIDGGDLEGSPAFIEKRKIWIEKNTRIKIKDSFYAYRQLFFEKIKTIKDNLPKDEEVIKEIDELWQDLHEALVGFRDDDGQPDATIMTPEKIAMVKDRQEKLQALKQKISNLSGLTPEESEELTELVRQVKNEEPDVDRGRMQELFDKKSQYKLNDFVKADLLALYQALAELQSKVATDYYTDIVNTYLEDMPDLEFLKKATGADHITRENADVIFTPEILAEMFRQSPEFEVWFNKNHIKKSYYDKKLKKKVNTYERLYVWNATIPNDDSFYETTDILDEQGNVKETIRGIPTLQYYKREVKPEWETTKIEMGSQQKDVFGDIIPPTIDNQGNFLPKTLNAAERAAILPITIGDYTFTPQYRNDQYFEVEKNNPKLFAVLEKLKQHHIKYQENAQDQSKLGLDIPRYLMSAYEKARVTKPIEKAKETVGVLRGWLNRIKTIFSNSGANYDLGQNFDRNFNIIKGDLLDPNLKDVPVGGLFKLELEDVSLDITESMMRYMLSIKKQNKLIEILPQAQALVTMLDDVDNGVKEFDRLSIANITNKTLGVIRSRKGASVRKEAIKALYEREFMGIYNVGKMANNKPINQAAEQMFKMASFGIFALNIPSALKNSFSAIFQNMVLAAGGKDLTLGTYNKGVAWSFEASLAMTSEIYTKGSKSLTLQLIDVFDVVQGRFEDKFGKALSRNLTEDIANLTWMMSPRKFTEVNAVLGLFGGMMSKMKVEQTINGETKKIPYLEAWEIINGQITLKPGIDEKYAPGGSEFKIMLNKVHMAASDLNGAMAKYDQPDAQRNLMFRLVSFLRKYMTSMLMNRFGAKRRNIGHNTVTEGFYRTTFYRIPKLLTSLGKEYKFLSPMEQANVRKLVGELLLIAALMASAALVFGWDSDDEDRYEKLRQRSGALPLPFTTDDPNHPFKPLGWVSNQLLALTLNVTAENAQWLSPTYYTELLEWKTIAAGPTIENVAKIFKDLSNTITGNDRAYYKRDMGPYDWQQKGSNKVWAHTASIFGLTGSFLDPVKGVKNYELIQARR